MNSQPQEIIIIIAILYIMTKFQKKRERKIEDKSIQDKMAETSQNLVKDTSTYLRSLTPILLLFFFFWLWCKLRALLGRHSTT
jgi:uncharacterized membrane protein (DUF106 family)